MIYATWIAILLVVAGFAWYSSNRIPVAAGCFIVIAFPLLYGLGLVQGVASECDFNGKVYEVNGYNLKEDKGIIYLLLADDPPIFCHMPYSIPAAEKLQEGEMAREKGGKMYVGGDGLTGAGDGGYGVKFDIKWPEGEAPKNDS